MSIFSIYYNKYLSTRDGLQLWVSSKKPITQTQIQALAPSQPDKKPLIEKSGPITVSGTKPSEIKLQQLGTTFNKNENKEETLT